MTRPLNLLYIMSDQHNRRITGCYGDRHVKTPSLDRLAVRGTLFRNAYSPSPICVPARAALATGLHVHETGNWDNATPYDGSVPGWGHRLQENGVRVESIGKLHYRNESDPTGFDRQIIPMHVVGEQGDVLGAVKDPMPVRKKARDIINKIGIGESTYTNYDRQIVACARDWLFDAGGRRSGDPWVLFVSLVAPHPPWFAPNEFHDLYDGVTLPAPVPFDPDQDHPWLALNRQSFEIEPHFTPELRERAAKCYYALTSFMDHNVGILLETLEEAGLADATRVIYTSDHGENLGAKGLWGKSTLTEDSGGVPMIVAGPEIPRGRKLDAPVSLLDIYPSVLETAGIRPNAADSMRSGRSLFAMAQEEDDPQRVLLTQYHAAGAASGAFMVRSGRMKYMHYVGFRPQLYDLACDPLELDDLALKSGSAKALSEFESILRALVNPEEVDAKAKADQRRMVEREGGRDAVIQRGSFGATPAPGESPVYE